MIGYRRDVVPGIALLVAGLLICGCGDDAAPPASTPLSAAHVEPEPDPATLRKNGLAALESGDVEEADAMARAAMAVDRDGAETIFLMAFVLAEQSRFHEAIKLLDDLAAEAPTSRLAVLGQTAEWLVILGNWSEAERRCNTILEQVPNEISVYRLLVHLFVRQGRRVEAAPYLRQLCRYSNVEEPELRTLLTLLHPFTGDATYEALDPIGNLGNARVEICHGNWDAAAETLNQSDPMSPDEIALLGRIHAEQQNFELLETWAHSAPQAAKSSADYWFAMGVFNAHQGDHRAAIKSFCGAVVRDQTDKQAYRLMSRSLAEIKADTQAKEASLRAELIERTQQIGDEMAGGGQRDLKKMTELIDLLDQLRRPFEALAWRVALLMHAGSQVSQSAAQAAMAEINQERVNRLQANVPEPSRQFLLCGVNLEILRDPASPDSATESRSAEP